MKENRKACGRVWRQVLSSKSNSMLFSIASVLLLFGGLHHITRNDLGGGVRSSDNENMDITPSSNTNTTKPVDQIILLGERHSGTNWITGKSMMTRESSHCNEIVVLTIDNNASLLFLQII